ncbi:MAG: restriction endonuclease subunit S, partial [Spirulinaceae cyanobacterium]
MGDDLSDLPEGWVLVQLGEVFSIYVGATPSRKNKDFWGGKIPWVSSGEVAFCKIYKTVEKITRSGLKNSSTNIHPPGTILLGMIGEGKTRGQVAILEVAACNNQNSAAIRVSEASLSPQYIYYFLESEYQNTRRIGSGNNQQALNKTRVQRIYFPLPPLNEQHRIVAKIEELFSKLDAGIELLNKLKIK